MGKRRLKPVVVWFTGLSGSGKTTLARELAAVLHGKVVHLDGDVIRRHIGGTGFDRDSRDRHVVMVAYAAALLQEQGCHVVVSLISPYEQARLRARSLCTGRFVLVHVSTPLDVCAKRDPKGLYAKAMFGLIPNFTGVTAPYEAPTDAEVTVDTGEWNIEDAVGIVADALNQGASSSRAKR